MKKYTLLAMVLMLFLSFVLAGCNEWQLPSEESTTLTGEVDLPTEEPTTEEPDTEEQTTEEPPTEEPTTDGTTAEEMTTEEIPTHTGDYSKPY